MLGNTADGCSSEGTVGNHRTITADIYIGYTLINPGQLLVLRIGYCQNAQAALIRQTARPGLSSFIIPLLRYIRVKPSISLGHDFIE